MASNSGSGRRRRRRGASGLPRWVVVSSTAGALCLLVVALPRILLPNAESEEPIVEAAAPAAVQPAADPEPADALEPAPAPKPTKAKPLPPKPLPPVPATEAVGVSADGDLGVSIRLKWDKYEAGERVLARVRLENHSLRHVHVPAAGEPNPGLALVVLDADGREVRRIVEEGKERLPRSTWLLQSGGSVEWPITVVAEGESPLEPGEYSAYVEFRADPALARLGLPVWSGPSGPVRSDRVALLVTPKVN